jgi:hypothetical protein
MKRPQRRITRVVCVGVVALDLGEVEAVAGGGDDRGLVAGGVGMAEEVAGGGVESGDAAVQFVQTVDAVGGIEDQGLADAEARVEGGGSAGVEPEGAIGVAQDGDAAAVLDEQEGPLLGEPIDAVARVGALAQLSGEAAAVAPGDAETARGQVGGVVDYLAGGVAHRPLAALRRRRRTVAIALAAVAGVAQRRVVTGREAVGVCGNLELRPAHLNCHVLTPSGMAA